MFYEVIYEDGSYSVLEGDDEEAVLSGLRAHHERAMSGESGGPAGQPAKRVVRVLEYERHPDGFSDGSLPNDEVKTLLKNAGDPVDVAQFVVALWDAVYPLDNNAGPHDSKFKMPEAREVTL